MNWKYFIVHSWEDISTSTWDDVWLQPDEEGSNASKGARLYLTVNAIGPMLSYVDEHVRELELALKLRASGGRSWFWPYIDAADWWSDQESMIVDDEAYSRDQLIECIRAYLSHKGHVVDSLREMSWDEAMAESDSA